MNNIVKTLGVAALAGTVALAAMGPAAAQPWPYYHHHYYHHYYQPQGYYPGYYGSGYYPYYYDPGAAIAAGFIGGIFGTIAHAAVSGTHHVVHHTK